MAHWTVRVKTSYDDDGKVRTITETYLVNAETIEESQAKVREKFRGTTFDYEIRSVSKSGIVEYIGGPEIVIE
jgi:hypothetical protein